MAELSTLRQLSCSVPDGSVRLATSETMVWTAVLRCVDDSETCDAASVAAICCRTATRVALRVVSFLSAWTALASVAAVRSTPVVSLFWRAELRSDVCDVYTAVGVSCDGSDTSAEHMVHAASTRSL